MTKIDKQTEKDFLKAENFRNKNENNEAIKILKKIIKKEPKFPPFLNSIALSYANLKNFETGTKSARERPTDPLF